MRSRQRSSQSHTTRYHPPGPSYFPELYREFQSLQNRQAKALKALVHKKKDNQKLRSDLQERERREVIYKSDHPTAQARTVLSVNDLFTRYQQGVALIPSEDLYHHFSTKESASGSEFPLGADRRRLWLSSSCSSTSDVRRSKYEKWHYQTTLLKRRLSAYEHEEQQLVRDLLVVEAKIRVKRDRWRQFHVERLPRQKEFEERPHRSSDSSPSYGNNGAAYRRDSDFMYSAYDDSTLSNGRPPQIASRPWHSTSAMSSEEHSPVSTTITIPDRYQHSDFPALRGGGKFRAPSPPACAQLDDWRPGLRCSQPERFQWISDQPAEAQWNPYGIVRDWDIRTVTYFPTAGEPPLFFQYSGAQVWPKLDSLQKASHYVKLRQSYSDSALRDVYEFNRLHDPYQGVMLRHLRLQVTCNHVKLRRSYSMSSIDAIAAHNERAGVLHGC